MKIFTIIVTYNSMSWAEKCFSSLKESTLSTKVIVIDNGSTDGTVSFIKANFPECIIVESGENLGFAKANNVGIHLALEQNADYVFLLNHDAWVESDSLEKLVQCMLSNVKTGIVSPVHLTGDGKDVDYNYSLYLPNTFVEDYKHERCKLIYEVEKVNAAAWLMNVDMIRMVGGFDTSLFKHYGEDENFCQRAHYFGWNILVYTGTTIYHDRVKRVSSVENYREGVLGQKTYEIGAKVIMGDINKDVHISYHIIRQFILMVGWYCFLQIDRADTHKTLWNAYIKVKKSRKINKKGGLVWL